MDEFSASKIFEEKGHDDEKYTPGQTVAPEIKNEVVYHEKQNVKSHRFYKSLFLFEKNTEMHFDNFKESVTSFAEKTKNSIFKFFNGKAEKISENEKKRKEKSALKIVEKQNISKVDITEEKPTSFKKTEDVSSIGNEIEDDFANKIENESDTEKETEFESGISDSLPKKEAVIQKAPLTKKSKVKKAVVFSVLTVLIFALFFTFLIKQNSYVYLSHDDYGYATLSYVYWEDGMWGQDFSLEQLTHYLTEHYNRWGGRILGFAQEILLLQQSTDAMRFYNAFAVFMSFVLALFIAQKGKKSSVLPFSALFACSLFGFLGENASIGGMYWYTASILYTVPVMYIFAGTLLLYTMLFGKGDSKFAVSKWLMLPFCSVLFLFGSFSMEQVGIAAVVIVAAMTVYSTFKDKNPVKLLYAVPPLLSSLWGYNILLVADGNNSRKRMYTEYYSKSFIGQILTSGKNIANSLFKNTNLAFVALIAVVTLICTVYLLKRKKNIFNKILFYLNLILGSFVVCASYIGFDTGICAIIEWVYLFIMAITISIWLLSSQKIGDFVIWCIFFGGLVSQAACLVSPVYHESCFIIFFMAFVVVSVRMFNQIISEVNKKGMTDVLCYAMIPVICIGAVNAGKIYFGFKSNVRVQEYNEAALKFAAEQYEQGISVTEINLMKLKNEKYTGSTMPYNRDLIKDWMKIYYKLPDNLQYDDFVYEKYDELRLTELEEELETAKYNFENGLTEEENIYSDDQISITAEGV